MQARETSFLINKFLCQNLKFQNFADHLNFWTRLPFPPPHSLPLHALSELDVLVPTLSLPPKLKRPLWDLEIAGPPGEHLPGLVAGLGAAVPRGGLRRPCRVQAAATVRETDGPGGMRTGTWGGNVNAAKEIFVPPVPRFLCLCLRLCLRLSFWVLGSAVRCCAGQSCRMCPCNDNGFWSMCQRH